MREPRLQRFAVSVPATAIAATLWVLCLANGPAVAAEEGTVSGSLIANGESTELPYVYAWAEKEGFYDAADPTWKILFVEHPMEARDLGGMVWDAAYVEIGLTKSAEFGDGPKLQVYSQSIRLVADSGGNLSGGDYPEIAIEELGPNWIAGRVFHSEPQEFFDDTYQYDFTFRAPIVDPNAPIGDLLPAGGGEPGAAYLAWVKAIHSGDLKQVLAVSPPELGEQLHEVPADEIQEQLEMMAEMTPSEVTILGGSTDGSTAILQAEGMMDGERIPFEVTLEKMGEIWMAVKTAM